MFSRHGRLSVELNPSQSAGRCFVLLNAANRVVRTIVMAIHDKILILRFAANCLRRRRRRNRLHHMQERRNCFLKYYSLSGRSVILYARQKRDREFDLVTRGIFTGYNVRFVLSAFASLHLPLSFFFISYEFVPIRRGSNRQNYVVAPTKRGISFLAFDGCSSVLCKDRTILFHVLE